MPKEPEATRIVRAMNPAHIKPETAARRRLVFDAPVGTLPKDLCLPEFWKHAVGARLLRRHDHIEAICSDDSWRAEYIVLHVGPSSAKLVHLKPDSNGVTWMVDKALKMKTDTHYVKFISPNNAVRYGVFRKSDNEDIKHGFTTAQEASEWMCENLRNIAA